MKTHLGRAPAPGASALKEMRALGRQVGWRLSRWRRRIDSLQALPKDANFVAISCSHETLAQTQIFPFHLYADELRERYGAVFREIDADDFERTRAKQVHKQVKWVAFQTWFDLSDDELAARVEAIRTTFPAAEIVYLDFFAPLDLRYARVLAPLVKAYVKKQTFRDLARYTASTVGDTNLTDYYGRRYGIKLPVTQHELPAGFEEKLTIGPNFCVSPYMLDRFGGELPQGPRDIDVHARITSRGVDWYNKMREEARSAALSLPGVVTVATGQVPRDEFLAELRRSKICFSPFGYGEVCWRDYEAIFSGCLLLKPHMGHVRLSPAIFVANETYVPLEWDCSDYAEKVTHYLADDKARLEITTHAFEVVQEYIRSGAALDELRPIFAPR